MEKKSVPLDVGARIGDWTVLAKPMKVGKDYKVECVCLCGTHRSVSAISLRAGHSRDCGCGREMSRAQNDGMVVTNDPSRSAEAQEEVALIRDGYMPLADQFCAIGGAPAWTLSSIAGVLGISRAELISHLMRNGQRFSAEIKTQLVA